MTWPTFESQDQVPEDFRSIYEERDGKWQVKESIAGDGGGGDGNTPSVKQLAQSVERLEGALESERELRKKAESRASQVEEELQDLKHKKGADEHGMTDEELKQFREDVRKDIESRYQKPTDFPEGHPVREAYQETAGEARKLKLDSRVKAIASKNGVQADRLDHWWKLHGDKFSLTEDDEPMVDGRPGLEVTQFITSDLKEETPYLYEGTKAAGGGSSGDHTDPSDLKPGTSGDDVLKNPGAALTAAREGGGDA